MCLLLIKLLELHSSSYKYTLFYIWVSAWHPVSPELETPNQKCSWRWECCILTFSNYNWVSVIFLMSTNYLPESSSWGWSSSWPCELGQSQQAWLRQLASYEQRSMRGKKKMENEIQRQYLNSFHYNPKSKWCNLFVLFYPLESTSVENWISFYQNGYSTLKEKIHTGKTHSNCIKTQ